MNENYKNLLTLRENYLKIQDEAYHPTIEGILYNNGNSIKLELNGVEIVFLNNGTYVLNNTTDINYE